MKIFLRKSIIVFKSYQKGETPIPCVLCNEKLNLMIYLKQQKVLLALITGHYIISQGFEQNRQLHRAKDFEKIKVIFYLKQQEIN